MGCPSEAAGTLICLAPKRRYKHTYIEPLLRDMVDKMPVVDWFWQVATTVHAIN